MSSGYNFNQNYPLHVCITPRMIISSPEPLGSQGELIVYPSSRRPSVGVVRRRRPSFTMLKDLLLRNRWANQSQILCGASLGRGNDILFAASGSHDQDGRHAHIWQKPFKKSSPEPAGRFSRNLVCSIGDSSPS